MKFQSLVYKEDLVPCPSISTVRKPSRDTWNVHEAWRIKLHKLHKLHNGWDLDKTQFL